MATTLLSPQNACSERLKKDEYEFRISKDDDDEIEYRVLLSEFAVCEDTLEASAASY
ncbi:MAG: hypothetical protein ACI8W1_000516 [Candidatus Azotimanducaceae bacterium]|jgi:hypothetical protein